MSSSQLTNSNLFQGVAQPPTSNGYPASPTRWPRFRHAGGQGAQFQGAVETNGDPADVGKMMCWLVVVGQMILPEMNRTIWKHIETLVGGDWNMLLFVPSVGNFIVPNLTNSYFSLAIPPKMIC